MYTIIENPKMMSKEEIDTTYNGNWVYVVKANIDPHGWLIEGMPVVLGDCQYDGVEEGIYEKYKSEEYSRRLSYMLIPLGNMITSVYGVEWKNTYKRTCTNTARSISSTSGNRRKETVP